MALFIAGAAAIALYYVTRPTTKNAVVGTQAQKGSMTSAAGGASDVPAVNLMLQDGMPGGEPYTDPATTARRGRQLKKAFGDVNYIPAPPRQ